MFDLFSFIVMTERHGMGAEANPIVVMLADSIGLGGLTVLMGAGLFAANRINIGKFLVLVGTGQGLITILINIALEFWSGTWTLDNNYVTWLTSTATGLGILFAVVASYVTKGRGQSIYFRAAKFVLRRRR